MATAPTLIRSGIAVLIAAIALNPIVPATGVNIAPDRTAGVAEAEASAPAQIVLPAYPEDEEIFSWAVGLFDDAGLALPDFTAAFHTTPEPCRGHMGLHVRTSEATTINICATHEREILRDGWRRRTLIHEMAHAWIDQYVPQTTLDTFMHLRGVSVWEDHTIAWQDQGAEHAAEALMFGLQDDFPPHVLIENTSDEAMTAAVALLIADNG